MTTALNCRLAVVFDMFGPYHVARVEAVGRRATTLGLEIASRSEVYRWDRVENFANFERRTLFEVSDSSTISYLAMSEAIGRTLGAFNPDAVLIPGWASRAALASLAWCLKHHVPAVVMSESTRRDQTRSTWKEAIKRQVISCFSAGLVGGGPQREYLESLGVPHQAIALGYNAVDNAYFTAGAEDALANAEARRSQLGVPEQYFVASSRFIAIKNLVGLLESFAVFRRLRPASVTKLVLLGDGEHRDIVLEARTRLSLEQEVILPGFRQYSDLPAFYGLATAFIHVPSVEPWGLVVNEAMAAGLPVVVSHESGCADTLVHDGENGFRVSSSDAAVIGDRLARLDADADLRARMGKRSREIVAVCAPDRFGAGALQATELAVARGRIEPKLLQRAALQAMIRRI